MDISGLTVTSIFILLFSDVDCSMKKGLGFSVKLYQCDDLAAFTNIYWWYDWAANFDKMAENNACDLNPYIDTYVPMVWGYNEGWKERVREVDKPNNKYILGFNEPNHQGQSNLTPAEAAAAWHVVEQAANGSKIVSPAAAPCGAHCNGNTIEWFDEFFSILCENETTSPCRVDYLATHHYSCNPAATMKHLKDLYDRYGLKIWLTEFACPKSEYDMEQLEAYMKPLLDMLEDADYVFRYAWYMARAKDDAQLFIRQAVSLLNQHSSQLTMLGEYYNNFYRPYTTTTTSSPVTTSTTTTTPSTTSTTSSTSTSTTVPTTTTTTTVSTSSASTQSSSSVSTSQAPPTTTVDSGSWKMYSLYNIVLFDIVCFVFSSFFIVA